MRVLLKALAVFVAATAGGCAQLGQPAEGILPPTMNPVTEINRSLRMLPPPERRLAVAVYGYTDQTGQFKAADTIQSLSRAVTQGATSVLIKALQDAGDGAWFTVVEREKLDNLLKERRIIADMRERYLGERNLNPKVLPPLLFAGLLLEGGIIGYDTDTRTGGAGARYLGIGGDIKYREDTVTIYLRAISTKTGEVLVSVVSHKIVVSVGVQGGAFKYVALDKILEAEAGVTRNEPEQLAVQQTVEKAVYALIAEGAARGLWAFVDKAFQRDVITKFEREQSRRPAETAANSNVGQQGAWAVASGPSEVGANLSPRNPEPTPAAAIRTSPAPTPRQAASGVGSPPSITTPPAGQERRVAQSEQALGMAPSDLDNAAQQASAGSSIVVHPPSEAPPWNTTIQLNLGNQQGAGEALGP